MKKIFFIITLSLLLGFIFLPNLTEAWGEELEQRINKIINELILGQIVPAIGGLALVIAGILFMLSGANPSLREQAKMAIIYIVIGIIIILGAKELVNAVKGG